MSPARRVIIAALGLAVIGGARATAQSRPAEHWVEAWASAQQAVYAGIAPPPPGLSNATLRQVVRLTVAGRKVRVRLSNEFGNSDLTLAGVHIAASDGGAKIRPETDRPLTFDGKMSVTVPAGAAYWSDPANFETSAGSDLAVTMLTGAIDAKQITEHPGARCTSYAVAGDLLAAVELADAVTSEHWYFVSGVDVQADEATAAVVALGDSITDGRGSTTNGNGRWPDALARRLQTRPTTRPVAVLNAGIGGNRVLHDGLGPSALARFDRDVLAKTAVRWVIVLEGVNDIGTAKPADAAGTAERLIGAYRQMITRAHAQGLKIFGGTITSFAGSQYDTPEREAARQTVNAFIRGGTFDAVIDFDAAVRDPNRPAALQSALDSGDHLHLNDAGYRTMADAVDLGLFAQ